MMNETPEGEWDNIRPYWKSQARAKSCSTCLHQMDLRENQCELDMRATFTSMAAPSGNLIMVYMNGGLLKMGLFSKRKKTPPTPMPPKLLTPCERGDHLYRDFPPVIVYTNRPGDCYIAVRETYVCVMCGKKKEVTLEKQSWDHQPSDKIFEDAMKEMRNKYKGWAQPIARVNDMIEDTIHVDRERLRIWEMLHAPDKQADNAVKYTLQLLERDKNEMDTGKMGDE